MPQAVCAYAGAAGACSTRICCQSASSSSAISIGKVVQMPWPISECASNTVMRLSVPMRRNALGTGSGGGVGCAASTLCNGSEMPMIKPVLTTAVVCRNLRRDRSVSAFTVQSPLRKAGAKTSAGERNQKGVSSWPVWRLDAPRRGCADRCRSGRYCRSARRRYRHRSVRHWSPAVLLPP